MSASSRFTWPFSGDPDGWRSQDARLASGPTSTVLPQFLDLAVLRQSWRFRLVLGGLLTALASSMLPTQGADAATRVLSGDVSLDSLTVEAGEIVRFDPDRSTTLTLKGSVIVRGTLEMRPSSEKVTHVLRFVDVNEAAYVGGGDAVTPGDIGLWVEEAGVLDARGTPKAAWNREGADPTWSRDDELVVAPTAPNDFRPRAFAAGSPVPQVVGPAGLPYSTEVANLTRNVRIEGTPGGRAHLRFHSTGPQRVSYVSVRWMGPRKDLNGDGYSDPIAGRTAMHFHRMDDGSRGSVVEGVVLRDVGGAIALDLHRSSGVTVRDSIVYEANGDGFGWENNETEPTHDTLLERNLALSLEPVPVFRGYTQAGFILGNGLGNVLRDSAASAVRGNNTAAGFHWPSGTPQEVDQSWSAAGLVSHNNKADGVYAWQNSKGADADIDNVVVYRNGKGGVDHGAYANAFNYTDVVSFENGVDLILHGKSIDTAARPMELVGTFGSVLLPKHSSNQVRPGVVRGSVKSLFINESTQAGRGGRTDFVDTGLQRTNVAWKVINASTVVRVKNGPDCWQVTRLGIATIPCWA